MPRYGGRKVYRNSSYYKKKKIKKSIGVATGVLVLGILVFVGYSVAKPIMNYFLSDKIASETEAKPWSPPTSDKEFIQTSVDNDENTEDNKNNTADNTTENKAESKDFTAVELPVTALSSSQALSDYLTQARDSGFNAVFVEMKSQGGSINYKTLSEFAAKDEAAVQGTMPAAQIASIIKNSGFKAYAVLNLLEDNNRYGENRDGSYHNTDGTTWLDNAPAKGGKPWLSPFETDTIDYIGYLSAEISAAGFDGVIACGAVFPTFRNSDIAYIGQTVSNGTRYTALVNAVNTSKDTVTTNGTEFMLKLNAADIINDKAEVLKPDMLGDITVLADYDPTELSGTVVYNNQEIVLSEMSAADRFITVMDIIKEKTGGNITVIPSLKYDKFSQNDYNDVITALVGEGYSSYSVR